MALRNKSTPLYLNYLDELAGYTDAELGRLIRALLRYELFGEEPELKRREALVWPLLRGNADRAKRRYEALSAAGAKGAAAKWNEKYE